MKKNKIIVIFSSHQPDNVNNKFINHVHNTIGVNHDVICYSNFNQYSLTEVYNRDYDNNYDNNAIYVYCHWDIIFKTKNWGKILLTKFNNSNFDIIGVAGSTYLPETGMWWQDRSKMYGVVEHTDGIDTWVNVYAEPKVGYIKPVVIIDGLFMAVNWNNVPHKFDEDFKGFHFYDLSWVFPNYLDGCNIGVTTDIRILHKSIGMTNEQWEINRKQFVEKYKEELPINYTE